MHVCTYVFRSKITQATWATSGPIADSPGRISARNKPNRSYIEMSLSKLPETAEMPIKSIYLPYAKAELFGIYSYSYLSNSAMEITELSSNTTVYSTVQLYLNEEETLA